ncbi:microsomal signal peptidase 12 kDa subunit-domain-containing protein [Entophlyctis helioformis]|nr:microsomal signal peptidase 12 kDa subunit-domain-containing protein [Entophlyctis helioformis]
MALFSVTAILQSGKIDFQGQRLADRLGHSLLFITGVLGFIAAFLTQSLSTALYVDLAGLVVVLLLCVPPWPMYNSHPVEWQPKAQVDDDDDDEDDDEDDEDDEDEEDEDGKRN